MQIGRLLFRNDGIRNRGHAEDKLQECLAAWYQNGQIVGTSPVAKVRGGYLAVVQLPRADALHRRFGNKSVNRTQRGLAAVGLRSPVLQQLGPDPESWPPCVCRRRPSLILWATFMHDESPVRCGACFNPVPLFMLPATSDGGNYQDLLSWQRTYQAMDWLHIGSGAGEKFGYGQMSRHDSELTEEGRELAQHLENKARRPVYYYLYRYYGRSVRQERSRRCPSCGSAWRLPETLHRVFDFRCKRCRLLSNIAFDVR